MHAAARILSIDVGTQSARAIVFDASGQLLGKAQRVFDPAYVAPQPGWAEQDPAMYWNAVVECCQSLWRDTGIRPHQITALTLTTQRATMVCVDQAGCILRPAIVWLDQRRCTAPPPLPMFWRAAFHVVGATPLIAHLQREAEANWLAQHEPALWQKTARFLFLSGWLSHRLVGDYVDSTGCQVGFVPFDYRRLDWARPGDFRWHALAVRREQLPRLVRPGERLGTLTATAADALGLPMGIPVIAAAADKACEVLGCGVLAPDAAQLSFGTTATINTTQTRYVEVQRLLPPYPAAVPGAWNTEIQIYRGFWMVSWFKREFAHREQTLAAQRGIAPEQLFDELVRSVPPGSMGLMLQPYWSPGVRDPGPEAKGAVIGFGDVHTRAHFYRAILEGLVYGLRSGREQIERRIGRRITRLCVAGGGSQSDVAMQITADVFNLPADRPQVYETSALGAAINAAVGLGLYPDYATAIRAMTRIERRFEPDPGAVRLYDALYREVYQHMYRQLKPLYTRIRAITGYPP
ncbi:Sugar (pentulose or hexulose) kinase [Fontimonas thermophila]|uniref:Sugar (Pentulose or hexulose) kinase n=1 Tax=Fontimonas thermophila TaxID=1076937 RepID=A0A1I2HZZ9_9GAMM|nr:FGGY-family carbohydrate kinase [Fontimonas thermophila]SFF34166.1 Sugar (pentulose or hexulose) kinase [Fontimonas thermophila]